MRQKRTAKMPDLDPQRLTIYAYMIEGVHHCAAPAGAVIKTFGETEKFFSYFAGGLSYGLPSAPQFLGVWGGRNCARFRRLLRGAFAKIEIAKAEPPARLRLASKLGERLNHPARTALEASLARPRDAGPRC